MTERIVTEPVPAVESLPFWTAAAEGRFLIKGCRSCGKAHWAPRSVCPLCFSPDTEWREGSGRGVIYSFSVMNKADPPYAVAYVTLDEGPTMLTNIVDSDFDRLEIGGAVELVFKTTVGGHHLPMFRSTQPA